jgi:hypothetical protein
MFLRAFKPSGPQSLAIEVHDDDAMRARQAELLVSGGNL